MLKEEGTSTDGSKSTRKITCYCTNAQSLVNKRTELEAIIDDLHPDVIGITETWCNATIMDSEVTFENYAMFRIGKDSPTGRGGGVILYIHESLSAVACQEMDNDFNTSVWCLIKLERQDNLLVGLCYRSPNSTEQNSQKLYDQLIYTTKVKNVTHLLIMGDFNYPEINWIQGTVGSGPNPAEARKFYDVTQDEYLVQHVAKPTRRRIGQKPSMLDLVLSRDEQMVSIINHLAPLGSSDHDGLHWEHETRSNFQEVNNNTKSYNYSKGDYNKIKSHFSEIDWDDILHGTSCNNAWNIFKDEYKKTIEDHVPLRKKRSKKPPWLKSGVKRSIKKKHSMYQKYRKTLQYKDYAEYRKQSNNTKKRVRRAQVEYEKKIMKNFKKKPKAFYSYVSAKQKVKAGVSQLEDEKGELTKTDQETANNFFKSVFTNEPDGYVPTLPDRCPGIEKLCGRRLL
ncbi:uncharacterized protein [Amphiura filiformis]|uniref:uncharacterized protein n=1 Tax=Amphiura filiformis TaxID=82378 RepID=UPI003B20FDFE